MTHSVHRLFDSAFCTCHSPSVLVFDVAKVLEVFPWGLQWSDWVTTVNSLMCQVQVEWLWKQTTAQCERLSLVQMLNTMLSCSMNP